MALELTVKSRGSLLPVLLRQDITPAQLSIIKLVLGSDITFDQALRAIPNKVAVPR